MISALEGCPKQSLNANIPDLQEPTYTDYKEFANDFAKTD